MIEINHNNETTNNITYEGINYKITNNNGKVKIFYDLGGEDFEINEGDNLYQQILNTGNKIQKTKTTIQDNTTNLLGTYEINDIKNEINIENNGDSLTFSYQDKLIGIINYSFHSDENNTIFLDFIGTINAKENDFENMPSNIKTEFLENFDGFSNLKIKGLGEYIFQNFINHINDINNFNENIDKILSIKMNIFNNKVNDLLSGYNFYIDNNGTTIVEL